MNRALSLCGLAALLVSTPIARSEDSTAPGNIVEVAQKAGQFQTLLAAATAAGLAETLAEQGPFTVLAPTDEAFAALPEGTVAALLKDLPKLRSILKLHVFPGAVTAKQVVALPELKSLLGQSLDVKVSKKGVSIGGANVVAADVLASNGVIHVIDRVLLPEADLLDVAKSAGSFKTLLAAVRAAGLEDTLRSEGPFTVFAPSDEAFAKLPAGTVAALLEDLPKLRSILKFHVVAGQVEAASVVKLTKAETVLGQTLNVKVSKSGVQIGSAQVVATDVAAANGLIHVIDSVLLPADDIVDVARKAGSFGTLLAAADAAGLVDTLRSKGPLTIFAPTDEAFAKIPKETLAGILADKEKLTQILTYHVVAGRYLAKDVLASKGLTSVEGTAIAANQCADSGKVTIAGAGLVKTDVLAANGVIHVVDSVLVPESCKHPAPTEAPVF